MHFAREASRQMFCLVRGSNKMNFVREASRFMFCLVRGSDKMHFIRACLVTPLNFFLY